MGLEPRDFGGLMMGRFDDLLKSATNFVEQHKGSWKHYDWIAFMTEVKKKGADISYDLQNNIGAMLESMKEYLSYVTGSGKEGNPLKEVSETVANFIKDTKGKWDHTAWEALLSDLSKKGIDLSEKATAYIGNLLESAKTVYFLAPKEENPQESPKEGKPLVKAEVSKEVVEVKPKEIVAIATVTPSNESHTKSSVDTQKSKGKKTRKPQ